MNIIDTHCHVSPVWYEPVEALVHHMDAAGVGRATLVQYHGQHDHSYQFQCERRFPGRFVSVIEIDTGRDDALAELERLAAAGARGLRLHVDSRSPGRDPLAIWRRALELGLPVTCGGTAETFGSEEFSAVVSALPDLPIVLEHLASLNHPDGERPPFPERRRAFALARYPNVLIKFHGLGEFCPRNPVIDGPFPFKGTVRPILDMALEAFGPSRMMWGSDWPPVSRREGYANALRWPMEQLQGLSEHERALMFGEVATGVYRM